VCQLETIEKLRMIAPDGLDAVLAFAGGETLERCLDLLRPGGRVAYPNGLEPEPRRRRRIRLLPYDGVPNPREFARLGRAVAETPLRVVMTAVYPLAEVKKAHVHLEQGHVLGRIVLRIRRGR